MNHWAEYLTPGFLFPEESYKQLDAHDPDEALAKAPDNTFCFVLYDTEEAPDLGPDFRVVPVHKNKSARFYIGGKIYTVEEIVEMDNLDGLLSNLSAFGTNRAILCRTGNWQPFTEADTLLEAPE